VLNFSFALASSFLHNGVGVGDDSSWLPAIVLAFPGKVHYLVRNSVGCHSHTFVVVMSLPFLFTGSSVVLSLPRMMVKRI
jgi:hypothetical protein